MFIIDLCFVINSRYYNATCVKDMIGNFKVNMFSNPSFFLIMLVTCLVTSSAVYADEAEQETGKYSSPVAIKYQKPIYPDNEARKRNEGIVEIEMMVDKEGNTFEAVVLRSTSKRFERRALAAVAGYRYDPALRDGNVVEGRTSIRIVFVLQTQLDKVSPRFANNHRRIKRELDRDQSNKELVDRYLQNMAESETLTMYALAQLNLMKLRASMKFGDKDQQIESTRGLLLFDGRVGDKSKILDQKVKKNVTQQLFNLLVQTQRFGDALGTYARAIKEYPELKEQYEPLVKKIFDFLKEDEQATSLMTSIDDRGYVVERLFNRSVWFDNVDGRIETLKFRCDYRFKEMPYKQGVEYKLPKSWGDCYIQVLGEPGTRFNLNQI